MLFESTPLTASRSGNAHHRVVRSVLKRYIGEDRSFLESRGQNQVPRFLLNDLTRYWRTLCVDFAYKVRDRGGKGSALRNIKLRMSRKLLFASGLLGCFGCVPGILRATKECDCSDGKCANTEECVACLERTLEESPLDRLAGAVLCLADDSSSQEALATGKSIFNAYDEFLGMLNDEQDRQALKDSTPFDNNPTFNRARKLAHEFRDSLQTLFFETNPKLSNLTKMYRVF
ncbi:MAG TPA: hypothetical protein VIV60_06650 [Polyangiaceae bacterium]